MNVHNENFLAAGSDEGDDKSGSDDPIWLEACRREEAIRGLLKRSDGKRLSLSDAEAVAMDLGISRATLYRFVAVIVGRLRSKRSNRSARADGKASSRSTRRATS